MGEQTFPTCSRRNEAPEIQILLTGRIRVTGGQREKSSIFMPGPSIVPQRYVSSKVNIPPVTDENVAEQIPCAAWVLGDLHGAVVLD
jgi:hypothetical protein